MREGIYAVYAFTPKGAMLASLLKKHLCADIFLKGEWKDAPVEGFASLSSLISSTFFRYQGHIFICATGIVVRSIAPFLRGKHLDPAVVVVDEGGTFAISLISGHLGGANELCRKVASIIGAIPVITTATDVEGIVAIDEMARRCGLRVVNVSFIKEISMAMLRGEGIYLLDPLNMVKGDNSHIPSCLKRVSSVINVPAHAHVVVCDYKKREVKGLVLCPPVLYVGVGCNRGVDGKEICDLIYQVFEEEGLYVEAISALVSTEKKAREEGIFEAARLLGVNVIFVKHSRLKGVVVPNPSDVVKRYMGVDSVCEAAALIVARGPLVVEKRKGRNVTVAVALAS